MSLVTRIAQEFNDVRNHLPISTPYNLLEGTLSITNEVITNGFSTTLYTGNGGAQVITDNVDMSTQWGNDVSEKFGGLRWLKSRSAATNNFLFNTIRGVEKEINSNTTEAEATLTGSLTAFGNTGFSVGSAAGINTNLATYASWNFQTTHRRTGITNHGKAFTEHYNPFTGFTIIKYEGSGLAGHEIPHSLGRKLGFVTVKNLSAVADWWASTDSVGLYLNLTNAQNQYKAIFNEQNTLIDATASGATNNTSTNQYILYGWANSYFDESNKLIGNYEIGVYQGTGAVGNKIKTRGKPAWVMVKRLDAGGGWWITDNKRANDGHILGAHLATVEITSTNYMDYTTDGFILQTTDADFNISGGQYLYMVAYDTNSNGGGSYYPLASDTANVQINNALIPLAQGIDSNGAKNTILSKNETITGLTYTQGKNYVYCDKNGTYGVTPYKPRYLESELARTFAGETPEYYDVGSNKWFSTSGQGELVTNGTGVSLTGWTGTSYNGSTTVSDSSVLTLSNQTFSLVNATNKTYAGMIQSINGLTIGRKYKLVFDIASTSLGVNIYVKDTTFIGTTVAETYIYGQGNKQNYEFTATATIMYIGFTNFSATVGHSSYVDNISVFATDIVPTTEITNSRNYLNHIVHADNDGGVLYVEELPKTEYKDIVKANEFRGKNALFAFAVVNMQTTPPTIYNSFNISRVIRIATGQVDLYLKEKADNKDLAIDVKSRKNSSWADSGTAISSSTHDKVSVINVEAGIGYNSDYLVVTVHGGRN